VPIPNLWKQADIFPLSKKEKRESPSVGNDRPVAILSSLSAVFEFIIYDHFSHFLKSKLNTSLPNLVTLLDFVTPSVCSQGQTDYFDFSNAFDILPHALLYHKLSNHGYRPVT
jgi:hypothetical protein